MPLNRTFFVCTTLPMIALLVLLIFVLPASILAGDAIPALNFSNSPRALSMGGCSATLVNEEAALFSPGALGLFHLDHVLGFNAPNNSLRMGPAVGEHGYEPPYNERYQTWGVSVCPTYKLAAPGQARNFRLAVALAFSHSRINYGSLPVHYRSGMNWVQVGTINVSDRISNLTGAVGVEIYHFLRFGAGCTYKRINSQLPLASYSYTYNVIAQAASSSGKVVDYGYMAQLQLHALFPHKLFLGGSKKYYGHFELTPSGAFVTTNYGDAMWHHEIIDQLPALTYQGISVSAGLKVNEASLFSVYWTRELQTVKSNLAEHKPWGTEVGVGGIFFFQSGTYISRDGFESEASGYGLSLRGVTTWLETLGAFDKIHGSLGEVLRRLDIRFDYAKLSPKDFPGAIAKDLAKSKYYKVTMSFAN